MENEFKKQRTICNKENTQESFQSLDGLEKELIERVTSIKKTIKDKNLLLKQTIKETGDITRTFRNEYLCDKNIISVFESNTTRLLEMQTDELYYDTMVIQVYYFDVMKNIIDHGFIFIHPDTGEHIRYVFFTASAGQIRQKKFVVIQEDLWKKHEKTFMCGLTIEDINKKGGANITKFLAYLALSNSATDIWKEFDIDKSIVVNDMELPVHAEVDYIENKTFDITRKYMDIPIEHTDGCGMILSKYKTSRMVRLPFVKGLLVPFPFDKFILESDVDEKRTNHGVIKDIYGQEHDVLAEDIEVIFTKSQFKMYKYFDSWEQYKNFYKKYQCTTGICNEEEEKIKDCKLNYQMLQTLTDMTDEELKKLSTRTINDIKQVSSNKQTMLKVLGVTEYNTNKNYIQSALEKYPELLRDTYSKEILKQVKKSMVKEAYSGKLEISGKYAFVVPDLYAFCEWLFLGKQSPQGLLKNGEVSFNLYKNGIEVDCLRSPHLFREHPIRTNIVNDDTNKWFVSNGVYTSIHDPISKVLQFDNDGDKLIVAKDKTLVEVAKRNNKNDSILPLYYEMGKADAAIINPENIYTSLEAAFVGGSIGIVSNEMTKIWNTKNPDLDAIKMLCLYGNNCIDYAKTLKKPDIPKDKKKRLRQCSGMKTPFFFKYAKDKKDEQVEKQNDSTVNRLINIIGKPRLRFDNSQLGKFDYTMLMYYKPSELKSIHSSYKKQDIIDDYMEFHSNKFGEKFHINSFDSTSDRSWYYEEFRIFMLDKYTNLYYVTDVLIEYLYNDKKPKNRMTIWKSFGDIINQNIEKNIAQRFGENSMQCVECGKRIERTGNKRKYCDECQREVIKKYDRERKKRKKYQN